MRDEAHSVDAGVEEARSFFNEGTCLLFSDAQAISTVLTDWLQVLRPIRVGSGTARPMRPHMLFLTRWQTLILGPMQQSIGIKLWPTVTICGGSVLVLPKQWIRRSGAWG